MSKVDIDQFLKEIDYLIQVGRGAKARAMLIDWRRRRNPVPHRYLARFARNCRRVGCHNLSLRILSPYVAIKKGMSIKASPEIIKEYAASLIFLGVTAEGMSLISGVDESNCPEAALIKCFGLFSEWRYSDSIPVLELHQQLVEKQDYAYRVGQLNLVSALVFTEEMDRAECELDDLMDHARAKSFTLLQGHALELLARIELERKNFEKSNEYLNEAERILSTSATKGLFFVKKWKAISGLVAAPESGKAKERVLELREHAEGIGHSETVRECDFFLATQLSDPSLLQKVYFGTPHLAYREKLVAKYCGPKPDLDCYLYPLFPEPLHARGTAPVLEVFTGRIESDQGLVSLLGQNKDLLYALLRDLYKPASIGSIFSTIFADEFYNPDTSPVRVRQAVSRLRKVLIASNLPLRIEPAKSKFRIVATDSVLLRLQNDKSTAASDKLVLLLDFLTKWGNADFSAKQVQKELRIPLRTVNRLLRWANDEGHIVKVNSGKYTRYRQAQLVA